MRAETWKTQTWQSLPVYTGDVSGVCSALYELGGMVVMHDPSGCNSTYNTHDEVRWTDMESLIFLSGLTQLDAITGNDRRLIDDIVSCAEEFSPKFIAIANSPVPWLIGTDFTAICSKVYELTGIRTFHVETNAMHDYTRGAGQAFEMLARTLFPEKAGVNRNEYGQDRIRVNVLGMTPLDFTNLSEAHTIRSMLESEGFEVVSVWAIGDTLENLEDSLSADVNLVVSSTGIFAARWMEETFGIPYVAGVPVGAFAPVLFREITRCAKEKTGSAPYLDVIKGCSDSGIRCVAGEPVTMGSVAADRILRDQRGCSLIPLTETVQGLIPEDASCPAGENQIREVLGGYEEVIADPMLKAACAPGCRFEELPHFALSGRMYLNRIRPLIQRQEKMNEYE